jgi:hypothetical protein
MGEGSPNQDAQKLIAWMTDLEEKGWPVTLSCGHYHGSSFVRTDYGSVILEGRGGSMGYHGSPVCGYTMIFVQEFGWTAHAVDLT